nr:nuclear transport factor 2 family protein [Rhodococcus wratislaviensis]GLK34671.1 hypothetical protein GCM10017611_15200 [Rhodococcus wratislaviensis]
MVPYSTLNELANVDAIVRLTSRYLRMMDTQCLDDLLDLYTDDAVLDANDGEFVAQGKQELRQVYAGLMNGNWSTSHIVGPPDVLSLEPASAQVMWKLEYWSHFFDQAIERRGRAYYCIDYQNSAAPTGWRISAVKYRLLFETVTPLRGENELTVNKAFMHTSSL